MSNQQETEVSPGVSVVQYRPEDHAMARIVEEFDVAILTSGVNAELIEDWCYCFRQAGEIVLGLSVKGVQAAVREMSKHGEVAKLEMPLVQTYEDEHEIRLVGTAVRWFVNGDGVMVETDRSIRALRQEKMQTVNDWTDGPNGRVRAGSHKVPDPKWYEKAHSKAVRNILLPLIRPDAVSAILNAFKQTQKYADVVNNVRPARQSSTRTQQRAQANATPARQSQAQQRPTQAAQAAPQSDPNLAADPRTIQTIITVLKDLMQTWTASEYGTMYRGLVAKYGPAASGGKQFPETIKLQKDALDCLAELRKLRGDPTEEDLAMTTETEQKPAPPAEEQASPPEDTDVPADDASDEDGEEGDGEDGDEPDAS